MICFVANTAAYCPTTRRRYIFHLQRYTFLAVPQTFSPYYYLQKQNTHDNRKKYIHPQCFCQTLKMLLPKPTTIATMPRSFAAGVRIPRSPASRPVPRSSTAGLVHPTSSSYISLPTPRQPSPTPQPLSASPVPMSRKYHPRHTPTLSCTVRKPRKSHQKPAKTAPGPPFCHSYPPI